MSENSEGCQTTPKGVKIISWHSRSVSKHLTGVDEHTGVIEHPFLKFNTPFLTVGVHHKGCQKTPKGVRLRHRVSKLFYSTPGALVNTSQELVNTLLVSLNPFHWCLKLGVLFNTPFLTVKFRLDWLLCE